MKPVKEELDYWRAPAVTKDMLAEACARLVGLGVERHGRRHERDLRLAGLPDADAAYDLFRNHKDLGLDEDEARGWLWVAACSGHPEAARMIGEILTAESLMGGDEAEGARLRSLALDWYRAANNAANSIGLRAAPKRAAEPEGVVFLDGVEDPSGVAPEPEQGPPGRMVVAAIGDAMSKEGQDIVRRYGHIAGRRLPYQGRVPRPREARDAVLAAWPWAEGAADLIESHFAVMRRSRTERVRLPNLLLVGGKGSGKTTLAEFLCRLAGLARTTIPVGGVTDAAGIAPVTRSWSTTRPGAIAQGMATHRVANPALVLDEIDKTTMSGSANGSVSAALLSQVGVESFFDTCLMADVDVTGVTFIATANDLSAIDAPLRDRFQVVRIPSPRDADLPVIYGNARWKFSRTREIPLEDLPHLSGSEHELLQRWFRRNGGSARDYYNLFERLVSGAIAEQEMAALAAEEEARSLADPVERFLAMETPLGMVH